MTIPPKARRYHASASESVRPSFAAPVPALPANGRLILKNFKSNAVPADDERARFMRTDPVEDGLSAIGPTAADIPAPLPMSDADMARKLDLIRKEKLSERQLRIARRIAAMHRIEAVSDEEAVLHLRERGIDPLHRATLGKILSSEGDRAQTTLTKNAPMAMPPRRQGKSPASLPVTDAAAPRPALPPRESLTEDKRAADIYRIQHDIARRRRWRMTMLALRLMIFVILPTTAAGIYYFRIASPLYATVSQFRIQSAEGHSSVGGSGVGGALAGAQMATNADAVAVQSYLTSRDAMLRLDADKGFRAAYQAPEMDPLQRLAPDATNEQTFRLYRKSVKIGYDPTEGMIDLEVIAPHPQLSHDFSMALIAYAEQEIDNMTSRLRDDQMKGAIAVYQDAEAKVLSAQQRVQKLQQTLGVLDPVAEGTAVMGQIATLETQLAGKRLVLGQIMSNAQPSQGRLGAVQGDIDRLEKMIVQTRAHLTGSSETRNSLALITGELRIAESDLMTRQGLLATAAAQMEGARIEANKQVRYLSLSVAPIAADEATYPKSLQNTLVAFLIFSGIYLMLSLTASILREQVST